MQLLNKQVSAKTATYEGGINIINNIGNIHIIHIVGELPKYLMLHPETNSIVEKINRLLLDTEKCWYVCLTWRCCCTSEWNCIEGILASMCFSGYSSSDYISEGFVLLDGLPSIVTYLSYSTNTVYLDSIFLVYGCVQYLSSTHVYYVATDHRLTEKGSPLKYVTVCVNSGLMNVWMCMMYLLRHMYL